MLFRSVRVEQGEESPSAVAQRVLDALPTVLREADPAPLPEPIRLVDGEGNPVISLN